jgi:hypothetical protein
MEINIVQMVASKFLMHSFYLFVKVKCKSS